MASGFWEPNRNVQGTKARTRDADEGSFKPMREWKQEEGRLLLVVYLPGFAKEQLNLTTEGIKTLRIKGWRLINGGRQQSFQEDFELPPESNMRGIQAKFAGGILTITIPRKTNVAAAATPPRQDTTPKRREEEEDGGDRFRATPKRDGASATPHSKPRQYQEGDGGDKGSATPRRDDAPTVKQEVVKPKQTGISESSEATKKGLEKQAADFKREITESAGQDGKITVERKGRAEGRRQPTETKIDEKGQENSIAKPRSEENTVPKKEEKAKEARGVTTSSRGEKREENSITRPRNEQNTEAGEVTASGGRGAGEKGKEDSISRPGPEEKAVLRYEKEEEKAKEAGEIRGGSSSFSLEKYAEAARGFAKGELKEETQLMLNMGVAVLVIVAFGAYISFTSFGKPKN